MTHSDTVVKRLVKQSMATVIFETTKQALLRAPASINVVEAAKRVLKGNKEVAMFGEDFHLDQLRSFLMLSRIFALVMPEAHARYKNKSYFEQGRALFANLRFPIYDLQIEEIFEDGGNPLMYPIPICGENPFADAAYDRFESLRPCFQITYLFFRPGESSLKEDVAETERQWRYVATRYKLPEGLRPTGRVDLALFEGVCKTLTSPLRYLGELFRMREFNTDSVFFNFDQNEYIPEFEWSRQSVAFLQGEYVKAEVLIEHLKRIDKWFDGKRASEHLADACRLYHRVRKLTVEDAKTKAAAAGTGKPLVGIL